MTIRRLFAVTLLVASVLLFTPTRADAQTVPPDPSRNADGVPVGRTTINAVDPARGNRPVPIDVWYPATTAGDYSYLDLVVTELMTWSYDNVPIETTTPKPLVLFSHALDSERFQSYHQMHTIASHGFIVAAPSHTGNTISDKIYGTSDTFQQSLIDRYHDMIFAKETLLASTTSGPQILMDGPGNPRMAATGHSTGAATALALLDGQDDAWMRVPPDPDVDVAVPIGPAVMFHTPDSWAGDPTATPPIPAPPIADKPIMIIGGSADTTTPPAYAQQVWDTWESNQKFRAEIHGITH